MPEFVDPYLDPASGVLRNRLGLTDSAMLDRAEAQLVEARRAQMVTRPIGIAGDLRQLQAIHGQLFQDVYEWAGQLRTVDMRKGSDPAAEFFMPVSRLETGAGFAFAELREDKMLRGMDRDRFVERLAHHYDQVNYLHPFREGNGRTQRIFWTQISAAAGYDLDWSKVTGAENDRASRAAMETQDLSGLRKIFDRSVEPTTPGSRLTPERMEQLRAFATLGQASPQSRSIASPSTERTSGHRRRTEGRQHGTGRDL
ncbi:Fic family protein [Microbacterium sp. Gd 4-13]|uniref:Fic/DOC family protein n=1 Tax=Microbacterium sp. Gd 4-13 TaxID=2173179 RepID=UPI00197C7782|nr:Fic family protein [Microbacterium sp. Gd 4-13]